MSEHPIPLARPALGAREEEVALRVLRSGRLTQGPELAACEEELAAACAVGVPRAMEGACACLSFHPRKVLTTGEGGAIVGDDDGLLASLRALRSHGLVARPPSGTGGTRFTHFDLPVAGLNYRLPEV